MFNLQEILGPNVHILSTHFSSKVMVWKTNFDKVDYEEGKLQLGGK